MVVAKSLFRRALLEAERHRYLQSERAGQDVGPEAIDQWHRHYWTLWLRHRWLEHLLGDVRYEEFEAEQYGQLRRLFGSCRLLDEVVEKVRQGAENIDVLVWAAGAGRDLRAVVRMLVEMRVNEIRCTRFCFAFSEP